MNRIFRALGLAAATFVFCLPVYAADFRLSFSPAGEGSGTVIVEIDPTGDAINAVEGRIVISGEGASFGVAADGGSIVGAWIEYPRVSADGALKFSGIIPGGFEGSAGRLLAVPVRLGPAGGTVAVKDARVLKNDGFGTEVEWKQNSLRLSGAGGRIGGAVSDKILPESFVPEVGRSEDVFGGKPFLSFVAQDKESGIERYEICIGDGVCKPVVSPYLLDAADEGKITVKAYDHQGNVRSAMIEAVRMPDDGFRSQQEKAIIALCVLLLCALGAAVYKLKRQSLPPS